MVQSWRQLNDSSGFFCGACMFSIWEPLNSSPGHWRYQCR